MGPFVQGLQQGMSSLATKQELDFSFWGEEQGARSPIIDELPHGLGRGAPSSRPGDRALLALAWNTGAGGLVEPPGAEGTHVVDEPLGNSPFRALKFAKPWRRGFPDSLESELGREDARVPTGGFKTCVHRDGGRTVFFVIRMAVSPRNSRGGSHPNSHAGVLLDQKWSMWRRTPGPPVDRPEVV